MKTTHWVIVVLSLVGAMYVYHLYSAHGSFKSGLAGLGINR